MEKESYYRYYSNEQLEIASIDSKLSDREKAIRRYLVNYTIDTGQAFNICDSIQIANNLSYMKKEEIDSKLNSLSNKNCIVIDEDGNINNIYPVSAKPTDYKVKLKDGREFNAMCAIDGIGTAFTFKQDVDIESKCINCGAEIKISVIDEKIYSYDTEGIHILHVDLNKYGNWASDCWNIMNFFCTEKEYDLWVDKMDLDKSKIFCLNLEEALRVSKMIFSVTDI